jgi:hypothetical protein
LPPVSLIPAANLPPVSLIPAANLPPVVINVNLWTDVTTGVNDTGGKLLATGVVDTSCSP